MDRNVTLQRVGSSVAELRLQNHSVFRRLVEVHKNHAGILFSILGTAFGLAMSLLVLSGSLMMFRSRLYRESASAVFAVGALISAASYFATLYL